MLRCDFSGQCPVTVNMCQYNVMSDFYNSPNYYYCLPCCHSKIFWVYVFALALCWIDLHASMLHVDRPNGHVADPWYDDWYCWVCVDHIHLENVTPCDSTMGLGIVKCVGPISCLTLCCLTGGGFRSQLYFCEIYFCFWNYVPCFLPHDLYVSAVFVVDRCLSVRLSVTFGVLYPHGWRYRQTSFSVR